MNTPPPFLDPQAGIDADHLRSLAIGHYILGALTALFGSFPIIHVTLGGMMLSGKFPHTTTTGGGGGMPADMQMMGWMFLIMGVGLVLVFWTLAILTLLSGRWLSARKNYRFCFVIACIQCMSVPFGTILGVFSILVLNRSSVRALFDARRPA